MHWRRRWRRRKRNKVLNCTFCCRASLDRDFLFLFLSWPLHLHDGLTIDAHEIFSPHARTSSLWQSISSAARLVLFYKSSLFTSPHIKSYAPSCLHSCKGDQGLLCRPLFLYKMIPILDFKPISQCDKVSPAEHKDLIDQVRRAASEYGFFVIINHSIPQDTIDGMFDSSREYFKQDLGTKMLDHSMHGGHGYIPIGQERLEQNKKDNKEALNIRLSELSKSPSSSRHLGSRESAQIIRSFWTKCYELSWNILDLLGYGIDLPGGYFPERHRIDGEGGSTLRFLHYLAEHKMDRGDTKAGKDSDDDGVRAGCHSDYGSITLLFQHKVGGLQVWKENDLDSLTDPNKNGVFLDVPVIENGIVVNVGDLFQFWTGSYYKSAQHRVVVRRSGNREKDADASLLADERYSTAFFLHPDDETMLQELDIDKAESLDKDTEKTRRRHEQLRMRNLAHGRLQLSAKDYLRLRLEQTHSY